MWDLLCNVASYFHAYHLTVNPSIPFASYFCAVHPLGGLFSCRPFNFHPLAIYFRGHHITVHPPIPLESVFMSSVPWASYFRTDHITLHLSIAWVNYFRADHPSIHPSIHPFGELFLCRPCLARVIIAPTI